MTFTLTEIMEVCPDWEKFCDLHGINPWAVNEGWGDTTIELDVQQAHHLGIVKLKSDYAVLPFEEVYPKKEQSDGS